MPYNPAQVHLDVMLSRNLKRLAAETARADGFSSVTAWVRQLIAMRAETVLGISVADALVDELSRRRIDQQRSGTVEG